MKTEIDNMTEKEIDDEMKELHDLSQHGGMTPAKARRLEMLRRAAFVIRDAKKPVYWL